MARLVLWRGTEEWLAEAAVIEFAGSGLSAAGSQLGAEPVPYRLDYELATTDGFITSSLRAEAAGEGWARRIQLTHDGQGGWRYDAEHEGHAPFDDPAADTEALRGALDCDLAFSPLTNLLPVRRHSLHEEPIEMDFLMAWVSVPDLGLRASEQRYKHVGRDEKGAVVRFVDLEDSFTSELELDHDGLVIHYPQLARRVTAGLRA